MRKSGDERTKRVKKWFERIGRRYEKDRFLQSLGTRYESWVEIQTVLSSLKHLESNRDSRILEVGIGTARISKEMVRNGHKIIGIDITPEMLKHSSEVLHYLGHRQDYDCVLSSMSHLPFRKSCLDGVICIRVLKYTSHLSKMLHEAHRVLKRRGIFVVEFPNSKAYYSLAILLDKLTGKRKLCPHVKYFILEEMVTYIRTIGFDVLDIKGTLRLPRSFYMKVFQRIMLETAIYIERALSWLLPRYILFRSYILSCSKIGKSHES